MKTIKSIVVLAIVLSSINAVASTYTLTNGETRILTDGGHRYIVPAGASVTLTQNSASQIKAYIVLEDGATVTLNGINVKGYCDWESSTGGHCHVNAIYCEDNATVIIKDGSTNTLKGGNYVEGQTFNHYKACAAIAVGGKGTTLTIKGGPNGTGKLIATGGEGSIASPGIGGNYVHGSKSYHGNIVIEGGDITAMTNDGKGVGIGASGSSGNCYSTCENITIKDSVTKVVARIGAIAPSTCETITIGSHLKQTTGSYSIRTITPFYDITFNTSGGGDNSSKALRYGEVLGNLPTPTREGYIFEGWYTSTSDGTMIDESTTVSGDATYYAHWELDPIPELGGEENVADTLGEFADATISQKITEVETYNAYRQWVDNRSLAHKHVKVAPNAWLAYVLDSPELIAKEEAVKSKDFKVDKLDMLNGSAGGMDFTFGIEDTVVGEEAEIDEAFEIEGSETLDDSSFSTDGLQVSLDRTADGRVKATVTPPSGKTTYFIRVKIK